MKKLIFLAMCLFISASITAETVYKKTNPDGSVIFTDQPSGETEEVKIRKPTTYKPTHLPSINLPNKKLSPKTNYLITIIKPTANEMILNNADITVVITLQPNLLSHYGHKLKYQLDGQSIISSSTSQTFKNVSRGTHSVGVSIIDKNEEVIDSASSNFHMKRFFKKPVKPKVKVP